MKCICSWGRQWLSKCSGTWTVQWNYSQTPNIFMSFPTPICLKMGYVSFLSLPLTIFYFNKENSALTHPESYSGKITLAESAMR